MTVLTLVTDTSTDSPLGEVIEAWAESIAALSNGAHEVRIYTPGELVGAFESFDAVTTGQVDMALLSPSYYTGQLPGMEVLGTAFSAQVGRTSSIALAQALATGDPVEDLRTFGLTALSAGFDAPRGFYTSTSVNAPEDLAGLKIRAAGSIAATLAEEAGMVPVSIAGAEIYAALQTGVIDGVLLSASEARDLQINTLMENHLFLPEGTGFQNLYRALVINDDVLAGLPADLRTLLDQSTGATLAAQLGEAAEDAHTIGLAGSARLRRLELPEGDDLAAWQALAAAEVASLTAGADGVAQDWHDAFSAAGGEVPAIEDPDAPDTPTEPEPPVDDSLLDSDGLLYGIDVPVRAISSTPVVLIMPDNLGITRAAQLDGATIALVTGSQLELDLFDFFRSNGISYAPVPIESYGEGSRQLLAGAADVLAVPQSFVTETELPAGYSVLPEAITTGGAVVPDPQEPETGADNVLIEGTPLADRLDGGAGDDTINGGDGSDTIVGGAGDDSLSGGTGVNDLRDNIFGGDGDDTLDGGYGNDSLRGDAGDDVIAGGFGADTVLGGDGDDTLTGSALGDLLFGGDGDDFINGGFGYDRVNGGAGADAFFHIGVFNHGSDWIQDYAGGDGDTLVFGRADATRAQFQINIATTPGAGDADVDEAFVIYRPTGQIVWALVDGAGQDEINLSLGGETFDLMA
ncbi:TRAP transporter substrate-binding protein DctP [uncultured Sulfitobacter sp.]|uniref:TRAP transporter substrate-binding protein DctP n=1 Tax=uncultured Sulfitobacter sp. TaxID=191468 RepID=UPI00260F28DC|nr:TRAP transporter substrate-binding protein DctP [uncultured Sulfitobacter sp.]